MSPYLIDKNAASFGERAYPSLAGLQRENTLLEKVIIGNVEFFFWLSNAKRSARITTVKKNKADDGRHLIVTNLFFHDVSAGLPAQNELQVDTVHTDPEYRNLFLAGRLYFLLADRGYSIVSDYSQYLGGKALWKKLARESASRQYVVSIWDDETQDWIKDSSGHKVEYNASNLSDERIWKDISLHSEPTTLLVLEKI